MEIVQWRKAFLQITDVYGPIDETVKIPKADIIIYSQLPIRILANKPFTLHKRFKTLHIDLTKAEETIFAEFSKSTRYNIKRAQREQLTFNINTTPDEKDIDQFASIYNSLAIKKNIPHCNTDKLRSLSQKGLLVITSIIDQSNQIICSHACSTNDQRAYLIYSCSIRLSVDPSQKNTVARANRFLHWMEILTFKHNGYSVYDFSGLSLEQKNTTLMNIDTFKKRLGGTEVMEYKCYEAKSLLGKIVLFYLYKKWKKSAEFIEVIFS